jgi:hypothetical protein
MTIQRFATGLCVVLLAAAIAAPAVAGPNRGRGGGERGSASAQRLQLRDGSCLAGETAPKRAQERVRPETATRSRNRLRDGSGQLSPTPAPEPPSN